MAPDLSVSEWQPSLGLFNLKQRKIRVVWSEFKEDFKGHYWAEGADPKGQNLNDFDFVLSLECFGPFN